MISKEQLNAIANKSGLNLYQQEKDYLLKLFLYYYYKKFNDAVFKGGTCLRYLFGLDRFSEDIDFNIKNSKEFKKQVKKTLHQITKIGIPNYFLKEELFSESYTCEIGFEGPLFIGDKQTRNKFRIDAGYRTGTLKNPEWKIIKSEYPEIEENFLVLTMNLEEIFAEKALSLFQRKKGRDLYDIWFLIKAGTPLNKKILKKKLDKEKVMLNFKNIIGEADYYRDMSKLTNRIIPYQQVKEEVLNLLIQQNI